MRCFGRDHDNITHSRIKRFEPNGELRVAGPDDPGFAIGMRVQRRSLTGFVVDQED
ncbi:hypothetical protein D3C87_2171200 [compost metagenome]